MCIYVYKRSQLQVPSLSILYSMSWLLWCGVMGRSVLKNIFQVCQILIIKPLFLRYVWIRQLHVQMLSHGPCMKLQSPIFRRRPHSRSFLINSMNYGTSLPVFQSFIILLYILFILSIISPLDLYIFDINNCNQNI